MTELTIGAGPAEPIGDLGDCLRPLHVRGPPSSNNIVYNIVFSSEKKNIYIYIYIYRVYNIVFSSDEKKKKKKT